MIHAQISRWDMERRIDAEARERARQEMCGREPGGGIFTGNTAVSFSLAQGLLGLGAGNARLAVRMSTFGGDVSPTFLRGRRTCHITCDDQDGQGVKDAKKTGKKKITFFYDFCDRNCERGYYLVGWGVHNGGTQYRLEGVVPPMGGSLDALRQWCVGMTVQCGTEKK